MAQFTVPASMSIGEAAVAETGKKPVTLERLAEGIRRAHAAGNVADVRTLGAAYRKLQAEGGTEQPKTVTINVNGRKVSVDPGFLSLSKEDQDRTVDEIWGSISNSGSSGVQGDEQFWANDPIVERPESGPWDTVGQGTRSTSPLAQFRRQYPQYGDMDDRQLADAIYAKFYSDLPRDEFDQKLGLLPGGSTSGKITQLKGKVSDLPSRRPSLYDEVVSFSRGAIEGVPIPGPTLADWQAGSAANLTSLLPAVAGIIGNVGQKIAQSRATSAAIANAPSAADLKTVARDLFKQVDQAGVTVDTGKFGQFVSDLATNAKKLRINPTLDPKAFAAFEELIGALGDVQRNGGRLAISDLHTLRQIAQKAAGSAEGRDAMFANMIVKGLDDFILKPGVTVLPKGANRGAAGNELLKAVSTWSRASPANRIADLEARITMPAARRVYAVVGGPVAGSPADFIRASPPHVRSQDGAKRSLEGLLHDRPRDRPPGCSGSKGLRVRSSAPRTGRRKPRTVRRSRRDGRQPYRPHQGPEHQAGHMVRVGQRNPMG